MKMKTSAENYLEINKKLWNDRTEVHVGSEFYNMEGFLKGQTSLKKPELDLLGDLKGKSVLHLQCHFGQDTISLARMGADATGIDLSDKAIEQAIQINAVCNTHARFICSDVYSLPQHLNEQFDVVFTSYGTIGWLPDMDKWASIIHTFLKPGGRFIFVEFHPAVWMFDDHFTHIQYSYFNTETILIDNEGSYADKTASQNNPSVSWNHPLDEVIGALLKQGLVLKNFKEYDHSVYNCFSHTRQLEHDVFVIEHMGPKLPMMYSLVAEKPVIG